MDMPPKKKTKKDSQISPQPSASIGIIGHVDHGKTTLVKALSGKWADTHSEEIKRGITIRLGYADVTINKCEKCGNYTTTQKCEKCNSDAIPQRKISLVDAPGHESLMATMLCGANIMDGALLLISATEKCPQPQTQEHLMALQIIGLEKIIVLQNKIDLVSEEKAKENHKQIQEFLKNTPYKDAPIIPISALHNVNIDFLLETIENFIPTPKRDLTKPPLFLIARSFDINKPGSKPKGLTGGILGGALKEGVLKNGEEIEIIPGVMKIEKNQKIWNPIHTKITGLMAGGKPVEEVTPGGTVAIMTSLDPSVVKSDQLVGSLAGHSGSLPQVRYIIELELKLLERVVGSKESIVVAPLKLGELLMLNVNSAATVGVVKEIGKKTTKCDLKRPISAEKDSRVTISRNLGSRWRLIGYGLIK